MKDNSGAPSRVRATDVILDDGRVFASPGEVGEVLDAGQDGGIRWVVVRFPGVEGVTTCILGTEVEPMLSLVPNQALASASPPPPPRQLRRTWGRRAVAAAAAVFAGALWCAAGGQPAEELAAVDVNVPSAAVPFLADVYDGAGRLLQADQRLPPSSDFPDDWKREPCPKSPRLRAIRGACFVRLGPPPCDVGYAYQGECVLPVAKGKPFPSSLRR